MPSPIAVEWSGARCGLVEPHEPSTVPRGRRIGATSRQQPVTCRYLPTFTGGEQIARFRIESTDSPKLGNLTGAHPSVNLHNY